MEIISLEEAEDRNENKRIYVSVLNEKGVEYHASFTIINKIAIQPKCDCKWDTWEVSRSVKTGKLCRHIRFALSYLKEKGEII